MSPAEHRYLVRQAVRIGRALGLGKPAVLWGGHPDRTVQVGSREDTRRERFRDLAALVTRS